MFHFCNFIRQAVTLPREFVPLELFVHTRCLELLVHLSIFLRQLFIISGEIVPHERFSQTSGLNINIIFYLNSVSFQDEIERLTAHAVFPFKVSLDFHGCSFFLRIFPYKGKICRKTCYKIFRHYFICVATVKFLQSSRFQTFLSNYYCWNAFVNPKKTLVKNVV